MRVQPRSAPYAVALVLFSALVSALALGGCSSRGASEGSAASGSGAVAVAPGAPAAPDAKAAGGDPAQAGQSGPAQSGPAQSGQSGSVVTGDKIVRTASLDVEVDDVTRRAADVRRIALQVGGAVMSENSSAARSGNTAGRADPADPSGSVTPRPPGSGPSAVFGLAVPADQLETTLDQLAALGTATQRTSSSKDVTSTYVDTQSRASTLRASLDQLRALMAKTTAIDQLVTLETELSRRQADLDSMEAQLKSLDAKVAASTITVTLTPKAASATPTEDNGGGFLSGLRSGWQAFLGFGGGFLTVLGALLPSLGVVAVFVGPALVWWRRRRSARTQAEVLARARTEADAEAAARARAQARADQEDPAAVIS
ncbi:DUF4349 domain-containing protein [Lapillicoccus sp.]|uniref:DUF4349 domain-containing protein n=1 Tax=Lapillicoccus sp. TaxID=1909287 RepID=UPI003265F1DC